MRLSVLLLAAIAVAASGALCEDWCANKCSDLNGDVTIECAGCGSEYKCRPGEAGFEPPKNRPSMQQAVVSPEANVEPPTGMTGAHGNPIQMPTEFIESFEPGACDLEAVEHTEVTREMLMSATKPFMIKGLTHNWTAHTAWAKDELLRRHAQEPFQLHAHGSAALGDLLDWNGKYHMGHAVYPPGSCYSDPWRPYSPMLFGALRDDYYLPAYLGPMVTFQMGVGSGYGIGVPPENHPSSWFAVIKGKKRWVLRPPDAGTSRSGGPGTEPPGVMQRWRDPSGLCMPASKPVDALHCDQAEGDVIWVPDYWWHETCGLEEYSIGMGALTYDGCCPRAHLERQENCQQRSGGPGENYAVADIPSCTNGERECGGLPFPHHSLS